MNESEAIESCDCLGLLAELKWQMMKDYATFWTSDYEIMSRVCCGTYYICCCLA